MDSVDRCEGNVPSIVLPVRGHRSGGHVQPHEQQALGGLLEHSHFARAQLTRDPPSHGLRRPIDFLENRGGNKTLPAFSSQSVEDPPGCEETFRRSRIADRAEDGSVEIDSGLHARSRAFCWSACEESSAIETNLARAWFADQCPLLETSSTALRYPRGPWHGA